jgi:large subunit ribosomal protein L9
MKVIILRDVKGIGSKGELIDVVDGYARNFLLPKGLAEVATAERLALMQREKKDHKRHQELESKKLATLADTLGHVRITISAAASNKGTLFGRVTGRVVCAALAQQGYAVPDHCIVFPSPIVMLGNHLIIIKLSTEHVVTVTLTVVADEHHA